MFKLPIAASALALCLAFPVGAVDYTLAGAVTFEASHPGFLSTTVEPAPASFLDRVSELEAMQAKMAAARYISEPVDFWSISWEGDCEDLALAAMQELRSKGWPANALHILVRPPFPKEKAGHAILCAWISKSGPLCIDQFNKATLLERLPGKWFRAGFFIQEASR